MAILRKYSKLFHQLSSLLRTKGRVPVGLLRILPRELEHVDKWGWQENIVGIARGWKGSSKAPCFTVFVRRKRHPSRLTRQEFIPERFVLSREQGEMLTDIVEVGSSAKLHVGFTGVLSPGLSLANEHVAIGPGSAGAILESVDPADPSVYLLGCAHVMALTSTDFSPASEGQFIEQPFNPMGDPAKLRVATLTKHFSSLIDRHIQTDDFAIARLLPGVQWDRHLRNTTDVATGLSNRQAAEDFSQDLPVTHYGSSTGPSTGRITHVDGSFTIPSAGDARFVEWTYQGLIAYNADSIGGDSGAAVLETGTSELVGIHTGGFETGNIAFFFPIASKLEGLGFVPVKTRNSPAV